MKTVKKALQITAKVGDKVELTTGETIKVTYVAPSKLYITGNLFETPLRDQYDDGRRTTDKLGITCVHLLIDTPL